MKDSILNTININETTAEMKADCLYVNGEVYTYKNEGLTRRVYVNADKTLVVKVPIGRFDQSHNDYEVDMWDQANSEVKLELAETVKLNNGYLIQEFVQSIDDNTTPEWLGRPMTMKEIRFSKSCRDDVGYTKDGRLVCYDFQEFKQY